MRLSKHRLNLTASVTALISATFAPAAIANTLPGNGSVAAGNATIASSGTTLTVNQTSANAVISWQSFSVGAGDKVVFVQPDANSATLNRVSGSATSVIAGDITANGSVYLINPNGIQITASGAIAVGRGFVASTLDIANADFLAGKGTFAGTGGTIGMAGSITTQTGGFVGLLAGNIATSGRILAPAGQVVIGAGTIATLDVNGAGFLQVALPSGAALSADGSLALVSGAAARDAVRNIVNLPGSVNAQSLSGMSGSIQLGGTISVNSTSGNAGHLKVLGESLTGTASLFARAQGVSGNGGEIETSGKTVDFSGFTIDTSAAHGLTGTWLLDPLTLTIDAAGASALSAALASNSVILTTSGASDATGTASATGSATAVNPSAYGTATTGNGDISVTSAVSWSSANSLTLQAYNNITISAAITASLGTLVLTAGNGVINTGTISATAAVSIGRFSLTNGAWVQNAAILPTFSATDFSFDADNASFLRVTGGVGAANSPYQITDVYGLQGIGSTRYLASSFVLANSIDATATSKWGGGAGFLPIGIDAADALITKGAGGNGFIGTLNGQGHTINGLSITQPNADYIGLIGYVGTGGVVENLGLTAVALTANSNDGALAGNNYGTITNSYATGAAAENGAGDSGGLVGQNYGSIASSYSSVTVRGTDIVGGLVGSNNTSATIASSYATGAITQGGTAGNGGGLAGQNYGTISDSFATGSVRGTTMLGGLVGFNANSGSVKGSYAAGLVIGTDPSNGIAGGLVGENAGAIANDTAGASYATGTVSGTINVGGLIGLQDVRGTLTGAYATGKVTGSGSNVGGLAGASSGSIQQSYATGAVSGANFVGGLVGANYGSITDTYATGSATSGALKGRANVGGLVGQNAALPGSAAAAITDSYAIGAVRSTVKTATAIGGLVGSNTGTIYASFFDTQTTGQNDAIGGTGVTTAALQTLSTFTGAGWTIDDAGGTGSAWRIYGGSTMPLLRVFLTPLTITGNSATVTYDAQPQTVTGYTLPTGANGANILGTASTASASGTNAGSYAVTLTGLYSNERGYDLTLTPGTLKIDPASLTVTANTQSSIYGSAIPALTYGETGLFGSDTITGNLTTAATSAPNVGVYAITQGSLSAGSNYTIAFTGANLTINPASLTVTYTANAATSSYGTTPGGLGGSVAETGLVNSDTATSVVGGSAAWTTTAGPTSQVSSYGVTGSGIASISKNYMINAVQAAGNASALAIDPASLTITANAQARTYGAANPALTYGETGLVNGDTLTGSLATTATAASNIGSYAIGQGTLNAGNNYTITYTGAQLAVTPASLTVTYNANAASSVYGSSPAGLAGSPGTIGLVNGDTIASAASGMAVWNTSATSASNVGTYAITGSGLTQIQGGNYAVSFAQATGNATALTINPASLTVTYFANAANTTYGTTPSGLTGVVGTAGLVNHDTLPGVTSGTRQFTTTATAQSNVGNYAITGSGLAANSANYTMTFAQAGGNATALTISKAPLIAVTAGLIGATTKTYDGTIIASLTPANFQLEGFVNGQGASVNQTVGTYGSANVGTGIAVTASLGVSNFIANGGTNLSNYILPTSATGGIGTITAAPLTLTYAATPISSIYGSSLGALTGSVSASGLVNGETIANAASGMAAWTTTATSAGNAGTYAITGSGLTALTGANYAVSFAQATGNATALRINPASLTVTYTANAATSSYGTTPGGLGGSVAETGLVNSDTATSVVGGSAAWTTTAGPTSQVSSYGVTGSGIASISKNYMINAVQAAGNVSALAIDPASLTITANAQARTYGAANPALTYGETGLVNGDTLTGSLATTATAASNIGSYAIGQGTLNAGNNYTITYTGAQLAVTPASLTVTYNANAASSVYGSSPAGLAGSPGTIGLVNGDTIASAASGMAVWNTSATSASNVGTYAITGSGLTQIQGGNYAVSFAQATGNATALTINPASLTVTYFANAATSTYGTTPGGLGGSVAETGLVNSDTAANVVGGTAAWTTPAGTISHVGTYGVTGGGIASISKNYTINAVQAAGNASALAIDPASLTVTANAQTRTYGAANPALTYGETGLINGDTLSGSLATTATTASNIGSYAIGQGTLSAGANYTITYMAAQIAVTPASLTLTYVATPLNVVTDSALSGLTGQVSAAGLVNGDTVASVTNGTIAWKTPASTASTTGSYAIDGTGLGANNANYTFRFVQSPGNAGALTISPAAAQFGSNTITDQPPVIGSGRAPGTEQALNGNNDVSQVNLDTGALSACRPGSHCGS